MRRRAALALAGASAAAGVAALRMRRRSGVGPLPGTLRLIDGEVIHYVDRGQGEPIVLIHGLGASLFSWRFAIEAFAQRYRVIALDLPGFGYSERDPKARLGLDDHAHRVARVMDTLNIQEATVVGHSMAGAIAQRLALQHPERVNALVLVAPMAPNERDRWDRAERRIQMLATSARLWERSPLIARQIVRRALVAMVANQTCVDREMVDGYVRGLARPDTGACLLRLRDCSLEDSRVDPGVIASPTLVLNGDMDPVFSTQHGGKVANAIPGATLQVMESCGHMIPEEQPNEFHRVLGQFLEGVPARE